MPVVAAANVTEVAGRVLSWSAPAALARDYLAVVEDLATPHAGGLATGQRAGQAGSAHWALGAEIFRELQLRWALGKEQLRIDAVARQRDDRTSRRAAPDAGCLATTARAIYPAKTTGSFASNDLSTYRHWP